ncbi:MAG: transposase [Flavobacteriales bacterium]
MRLIDTFVDSLSIDEYGFKTRFVSNGRPAYHPSDLLKLFIYGYMNRIRSFRSLERECGRNIEMMWLLKGLSPDHNTIANFRKDNPKAIKIVFRATVNVAKNMDLIGGKLLAGDSTKFQAQNNKKNNYKKEQIDRHIEMIDKKLEEYTEKPSSKDGDQGGSQEETQKRLQVYEQRKERYKELYQKLEDSGEKQISTSDPDSRNMAREDKGGIVAYNVQTTVDGKYDIPIDFKTTNETDRKAMGDMLCRAKSILRTNQFTALYDKGYHSGNEFKRANNMQIEVMVATKEHGSKAPDPAFNNKNFKYDPQNDTYTCPANKVLESNGK